MGWTEENLQEVSEHLLVALLFLSVFVLYPGLTLLWEQIGTLLSAILELPNHCFGWFDAMLSWKVGSNAEVRRRMLDCSLAGMSPQCLEQGPSSQHPQYGPGTGGGFVLLLIKLGWEALLDVPSVYNPEASPSGAE